MTTPLGSPTIYSPPPPTLPPKKTKNKTHKSTFELESTNGNPNPNYKMNRILNPTR